MVSVAGGAVLSDDNRRLLRGAGLVVWLRAAPATLAGRVVTGDHRPLLDGGVTRQARLEALYAERRPWYEALADVVIDVDLLTPDEVADQVLAASQAGVASGRASVGGGPGA